MSASAQFSGRTSLILNFEFRILKIRLACAFGNEVALTDDTAFGNEIAQTDDFVIVEATRTSALPKANRHSLSLFFGYPDKGRLLSPQGARSKGMMSPLLPIANKGKIAY